MQTWGESKNPQLQPLLEKMRVAAGKIALFELAPHSKRVRALLESGDELEKLGLSAKTFMTLARFRRDPTISLPHEDMLEVYAAAELLEMPSLLPDIFKKLSQMFERAISISHPRSCSITRLCELYNTYQGAPYLAIQQFLLIELSITLVPTVVYFFEKPTFEITPEIRGCKLGNVNLVDHSLFKAAELLFEFNEKKEEASDLTSFRKYSSQLPQNVCKWMDFRGLHRTKRYLESWPAIKELVQFYPYWSTVVKTHENWEPAKDALPRVIPPLIAQEPNNRILRENRWRMALAANNLDAQSLAHLRENTEFLIEKDPEHWDRYSIYRHNVKELTNMLTSSQRAPEPLLFEECLKLMEFYLLSSHKNCKLLPLSDPPSKEEYNMLENLMQFLYCSSLLEPCRPLSNDVLGILTDCLNKYPPDNELMPYILEGLSKDYPEIHAKMVSSAQLVSPEKQMR